MILTTFVYTQNNSKSVEYCWLHWQTQPEEEEKAESEAVGGKGIKESIP